MAEQKNANRLISNNKKAYFDYFIEDKYEAGLVLHGNGSEIYPHWENALLRRRIFRFRTAKYLLII